MATKKTASVTTENLVRLGAERLAGILLELANEQPAVKRRLRVALAGEAGGEIIAAEVNRRISTLRSARSFIDWQKRPDFVRDLDLIRATIAEKIAQTRPDLALSLRHLANLYLSQGKYTQAEPLYRRALQMDRRDGLL